MKRPHSYKICVDAADSESAIAIASEGLFAGSEVVQATAKKLDDETFEVILRYQPPQAKLTRN